MLQFLLGERFKAAVQRGTKELPVYALMVRDGGIHLASRPADYSPRANPRVRPLTMELFLRQLALLDRPVVDQTGLQGEYMVDIEALAGEVRQYRDPAYARESNAARSGEAVEPIGSDVLKSFGLKLAPKKLPMPTVTVEHIERVPTAN